MKRIFFLLLFIPVLSFADPMRSPTWGFFLDLPEGYELMDGDGKDRFSFKGPANMMFDLVIYNGRFSSIRELVRDVNSRISNRGDADFFTYNGREAAIIELIFDNNRGYGLCVTLDAGSSGHQPMLLALAYNPTSAGDLDLFHLSALDSIAPTLTERYYPGPVTSYSYPRGQIKPVSLAGGIEALIYENDAEISQIVIEREFAVLVAYADTVLWQAAWQRYYRFIFRDSIDRIANPAFVLAQNFGGLDAKTAVEKRAFAQRALNFVQGFKYERDFSGSDFTNLVTAVTERRGNCDSHAMIFASILFCANIRSGLMVSRQYSHAMGLADIEGAGARFETEGSRWLVAETTAGVEIGLIAQEHGDPRHWLGVIFE